MKTLIACILTALVTTTGAFAYANHSYTHYYTVRNGNDVFFPSIDLFCAMFSHQGSDLPKESGPLLECARRSANGSKSRRVLVSRYHIIVSNEAGTYSVLKVGRTP